MLVLQTELLETQLLLKYQGHAETTQSIAEVHRGTYLACVQSFANVQSQP